MSHPREGLAKEAARMVYGSCDVFVKVVKGIRLGEIDPAMALRINWSCRIQKEYSGLGYFSFSVVMVGEGQGVDSSLNPISTTWNWNLQDV